MPLFEMTREDLVECNPVTFAHLEIKEREGLQHILRDHIDVLGNDLLVVSEEYGDWEDARRNIDLLALDKQADYSSGSFLAGARVLSPRGQGSGWSARSRAAARTNELDAGKRRKIVGGGEGFGCGWLIRGRVPGSRCVAGGVVSQAPIRRRASVRAAAMTMCPGPGCSVR